MRFYDSWFHPAGSPRAGRPPVMVKEGLSWRCLVLGWVGLLLSGAWVAGLLTGALALVLGSLLRHGAAAWPVFAAWHLLLGLFGNDLRRWELAMRGLVRGPLVAGGDADAALIRLLERRPDLVGPT